MARPSVRCPRRASEIVEGEFQPEFDYLWEFQRTVTDEVRLAIEAWIDKTKGDPAIQRRAQDVRDEIEREAAGKRAAIAAIFDATPAPKTPRTKAATS